MSKQKQPTFTLWVPLAEIRLSERRRRGVDASTVERYREWLEQGREAPPVRLVRDGGGFRRPGRPAPHRRGRGRGATP